MATDFSMAFEKEISADGNVARPEATHESKPRRVSMNVPPTPPAKELKTFPPLRTTPPRLVTREPPRPMTSSSKRLSFSSMSSNRRPIKYGKGKYAHVELVPQPSDEDDDPLVSNAVFCLL